MAELLVRVVDKIGDDIFKDAALTKRGDVIVVCPDGWPWGSEELSNPEWRIISVPDMTEIEANAMTTREIGDRSVQNVLQERAFKFDLDSLPQAHKAKTMGNRDHAIITIPKAILNQTKKQKPKKDNPFIVGN